MATPEGLIAPLKTIDLPACTLRLFDRRAGIPSHIIVSQDTLDAATEKLEPVERFYHGKLHPIAGENICVGLVYLTTERTDPSGNS